MIVWKSLLAQLIVFGVRQSRTFELIRLFSYENDLHSRVKLGINKSKDSFTGVHSIIVQFSKVICHRRSDDLFILPNYEELVNTFCKI